MLKRVVCFPRAAARAGHGAAGLALAQGSLSDTYSSDELVQTGGEFFGSVAQGLASLVERAVSQFGLPERLHPGRGSRRRHLAGAHGEGTMYTRNQGEHPLFWQGPTKSRPRFRRRRLQGDEMPVYNLQSTGEGLWPLSGRRRLRLRHRRAGHDGDQYGDVVMVPIRSGVGLRAGVNVGVSEAHPGTDLAPVPTGRPPGAR